MHRLPDWFGMPESTAEYVQLSGGMPFWAYLKDGEPLGFIALKETSPYTAEICVMGVRKERHRQGIGKALFHALHEYAKEKGYEYLQVKTVRQGCYEEYDRTNAFYRKLGFRELECFPTLWDQRNPCQVYIMAIR